jgi:hypothetical protein
MLEGHGVDHLARREHVGLQRGEGRFQDVAVTFCTVNVICVMRHAGLICPVLHCTVAIVIVMCYVPQNVVFTDFYIALFFFLKG